MFQVPLRVFDGVPVGSLSILFRDDIWIFSSSVELWFDIVLQVSEFVSSLGDMILI